MEELKYTVEELKVYCGRIKKYIMEELKRTLCKVKKYILES